MTDTPAPYRVLGTWPPNDNGELLAAALFVTAAMPWLYSALISGAADVATVVLRGDRENPDAEVRVSRKNGLEAKQCVSGGVVIACGDVETMARAAVRELIDILDHQDAAARAGAKGGE